MVIARKCHFQKRISRPTIRRTQRQSEPANCCLASSVWPVLDCLRFFTVYGPAAPEVAIAKFTPTIPDSALWLFAMGVVLVTLPIGGLVDGVTAWDASKAQNI